MSLSFMEADTSMTFGTMAPTTMPLSMAPVSLLLLLGLSSSLLLIVMDKVSHALQVHSDTTWAMKAALDGLAQLSMSLSLSTTMTTATTTAATTAMTTSQKDETTTTSVSSSLDVQHGMSCHGTQCLATTLHLIVTTIINMKGNWHAWHCCLVNR